MGKMSRNKGKRGELELSKFLSDRGFESRRGRQYSGDESAPDVISTLPFHIECKYTEKISLYPVMEKAQQDAGGQPVIIFHRKNNRPWLAILLANEFLKLIKRQ